jgi:hypothetical protein
MPKATTEAGSGTGCGMSILPTLGILSAEGQRINDNGWITGSMSDGSRERGVIWQPVPEPASVVALGMGLAGVFCSRKRRIFSEIMGGRKHDI